MNAHGGVACHPVRVITKDDQSDSSLATSAAQSLIQDEKVVALVGSFSIISVAGYVQGIKGSGVPTIGGDGTTLAWTTNPLMFDVGGAILRAVLPRRARTCRTWVQEARDHRLR